MARRSTMRGRPDNIEKRAEGRPPEEAKSDDAEKQAAAILGDSEARVEEGIERGTDDRGGP
jgi:hypothetical protein